MSSIIGSQVSSSSASGRVDKHCKTGDCNGKKISGAAWSKHTKDIH